MSTFSFIRIDEDAECATIALNRPPLNIMNVAMMEEIVAACGQLRHHTRAKVLLLRAAGKAFSAGVDIADHTADRVDVMMQTFRRMCEALMRFPIPVIAVVDGVALGGGCELAISCDMVVASERAKFGQPEIAVGVFPPVAAVLLPRLIGRNRTLEWLLSGESIPAAAAERAGLVNKVLPVEGFEEGVKAFVSKFTVQSGVILQLTKKAVDASLHNPVGEGLAGAENIYLNEMMKTEDAVEGLKAFLEKRQPKWKNR